MRVDATSSLFLLWVMHQRVDSALPVPRSFRVLPLAITNFAILQNCHSPRKKLRLPCLSPHSHSFGKSAVMRVDATSDLFFLWVMHQRVDSALPVPRSFRVLPLVIPNFAILQNCHSPRKKLRLPCLNPHSHAFGHTKIPLPTLSSAFSG